MLYEDIFICKLTADKCSVFKIATFSSEVEKK